MKRAFVLCWFILATASTFGDEAKWSNSVNGLRARLSILPPAKPSIPFCRVYLEMENVDNTLGQKRIRFDTRKITFQVTDQNGNVSPPSLGDYSAFIPDWKTIALPHEGTIKFRISNQGLGYDPRHDKLLLDLGSRHTWIVPRDGSRYFLSGSLTIEREPGDHPYSDWSGTLDLPKVEVPKAP